MKRDFNAILNTIDGEPFKDDKGDELTLKRVSLDALGAPLEGDDKMSGDDKFKLYELANRIAVGFRVRQPVEVDEKDIATLKARIAKVWGVFVLGPAYEILGRDYVAPDAAQLVEDVKAATGIR